MWCQAIAERWATPDSKRHHFLGIAGVETIRRLWQLPGFRDRIAYTALDHLGQTYLTQLEDKMLHLIEQEYGVKK